MTLSSSEKAGSHPVGEGLAGPFRSFGEGGVFVVGGSETFDVAARVVDGWPSGSGTHDMRIAATESIDNADFSGHNKYMTTTAAKATIKTVGQSLYLISTDRNGNQRVEFVGTREYGEALMAYRNAQVTR